MNKDLETEISREVPSDDSASVGEKQLLYWLIRETKPRVAVETGTHRGLATLYMAAALADNAVGHLTTYDPFEWGQVGNFAKFSALNPYITYKQARGDSMQEEQIDFAFIDGFHGLKDVIEELSVLIPRLAPRAIVVLHDCWYEKEEVHNGTGVNDALESYGLFSTWLPTTNAIRIYSRHEDRPTGPL